MKIKKKPLWTANVHIWHKIEYRYMDNRTFSKKVKNNLDSKNVEIVFFSTKNEYCTGK